MPNNDTFDDSSSPRINITLCGVPPPIVVGEFLGLNLTVRSTEVNSYTHNYTLELPPLTQRVCGKELTLTATVTATRYNGNLTRKMKIFVKNCKYDLMFF